MSHDKVYTLLAHAERVCLNHAMHAALANLRAICDLLDAHDLTAFVYLDLTEIQNLGYYTGITFEALTPGLGFPVASGGRYDHLIGRFGRSIPSTGFALNVDRLFQAVNGVAAGPAPVRTERRPRRVKRMR